jgi:hypothetical protein
MNVTAKQMATFATALGLSGVGQPGLSEGGFILPDFVTDLFAVVPAPVLVAGVIAVYVLKPQNLLNRKPREIVCSSCDCVIGTEKAIED